MLLQRILQGKDAQFEAIGAAGGLFVVPPDPDPERIRQAVLVEGVRALEVQTDQLDFLTGLPLEFLNLNTAMPHIDPVNSLCGLRGLHVDAWTGHLDFRSLPQLEWFGTSEAEQGQLADLFQYGHVRLHHLAIGKYRERDLSPLGALPALSHLSVGDSRVLTTLAGIGSLPRLRHLDIYSCRALATLSGIEAASSLQHVELSRCNRIDRIDELAMLPDLRSLQIEMDHPPSLAPLAGHPTLQYLWLVGSKKPSLEDFQSLLETPSLRFLYSPRGWWLRDGSDWVNIPDLYAMNADEAALHEKLMSERDLFAVP